MQVKVRQTVAIVVSLILVLALGMWGQYVLSPSNFHANFLTALYEVVMLFALGGDWTTDISLPWQLEMARLLAPAISIAGVLIILTRGAWVGLTNLFIRFWRGHVVVVGLGEKGWQFAVSCAPAYKTVIIERDVDNPLIERARQHGIAVIVGDILDESIMVAANLANARHLVTFCGNDGTSVEIAIRVREFLSRQPRDEAHRLRIHLHVDATRISSRIEAYAKFYDAHKVAEVDFFSVYDLSARILLNKYPPDIYADAFGQREAHIALYGFGLLAEQILTEAVRVCHFLNGSRLRFTVFAEDATEKIEAVLRLHPGIRQLCEIAGIEDVDLRAPILDALSDNFLQSVTEHVVCLHDDEHNLELALALRAALLERVGANAPINVRMQHSRGLAQLLESREGEPEIPDGLYPFGMLNEVLDYDNILSDRLDGLAQAIHEDYLARREGAPVERRFNSALSEWRELPEPDRKSNRLQADHLAAKLRAIRCRYGKGIANRFEFTAFEAESLARMEHDRWRANKIFAGWRQGAQRMEGARVNPFAVPWDEMDVAEREGNIAAIERVPEILRSQLGWRIQRELYVGVTGHRPHRLDMTDKRLKESIERELAELVARYADRRHVLVSPLAEGADRLVARIAMEQFGMALHVPLPLPFELYQTDFASPESLDEFKELMGLAESYFELPMRFGTIQSLAANADGTSNDSRNCQYALVGAYITQVCDELIAIYDGGEVNGVGGTADIIKWRSAGELPREYQNAADFFVRPPMSKPVVINIQRKSQA